MAWQEFDPFLPTPKPVSFWSKVHNLFKKVQPPCPHPNGKVTWIVVQPITMLPKTGECQLCGKRVKAKILWE